MTEFDSAFDEFVTAGLAPWIAHRTGDGFDATDDLNVPPGAPNLPRLDATFIQGLLGGQDNATNWYFPEFTLLDGDDPAFQVAVTQKAGEVTPQGRPVNQATLTLIEKWQQPVIDAVLTGYSNAKAEAHSRTAKLIARNPGIRQPRKSGQPCPHGHHPSHGRLVSAVPAAVTESS